jgi:2-polyprenyl-6-methoxyphenol hydroxylase-like FAD-dependent oxidoreductase
MPEREANGKIAFASLARRSQNAMHGVPIVGNEFDVVIVGGGPVGLWLASELALAKVKVVVLERRAERVTQSRALAIHGRTLEVFALRGFADRFLSCGRRVPTIHFGALDTTLDFSVFDTRFPFLQLVPQATTEKLLEQRALELGADIRRGHLVETVEQHAEGVVIGGRNGEAAFQLSARYLVGADGARSMVRRAAGIDFSGHPARHTMMLADAVLDAPPIEPMVTIVNEAGSMIVVQLSDGVHHRVVVVDAPAAAAPAEHVSLAELASAAKAIARVDFRPRDPIWLSRFTDETRLAEHYRNGRLFLAGDAAHIHAPMGGQGMNVGIQDAMNLGWKLASVVQNAAPEALLDTYEAERWPVGEAVRRNTLAQLALFCAPDASTIALRRTLEDILRVPEVNRRLADEVSGFGVAYPEPLFLPDPGWEHRKGVSGQRLPDMDLMQKDGSRTTLYRYLEDGRWIQLQSTSAEISSNAGAIVRVDLAPDADEGLLADFASVLVRPDGYLAHVRPVDAA